LKGLSNKNKGTWSPEQVQFWLEIIGLPEQQLESLQQRFNGIDGKKLATMGDDYLQKVLQIADADIRQTLLKARDSIKPGTFKQRRIL
jgi:hypothetical protein